MTLKPLLPKEHGAWAMLIVPLLLGIMIAPVWHWRVIILVIAAFAFFLVRHPLAMLVKTRKRKKANRAYFWQWVAIYGSITALSGGYLVLGQGLWWLMAVAVIGGSLLVFHLWLVTQRQEMSVIGELSGILGLALGAPMAYYVASTHLDSTAAALWLINALYFGSTVFYIKLKVRQQPRSPAPAELSQRLLKAKASLIYQIASLLLLSVLAFLQHMPYLAPVVLLPATIKVFYGASQWQDKKSLNLMRLGIIEIIHSAIFAILVVITF